MTDLCHGMSDEQFIEQCYSHLLKRAVDPAGMRAALEGLRSGASRLEIAVSVAKSPEHYSLLTHEALAARKLPDLRQLRPGNYKEARKLGTDETVLTFEVGAPSDLDWLENMIGRHGYYDRPGVWSLVIDQDKEVTAQIVRELACERVLELGCASGPVLKLLSDAGIDAEGVEISHMAMAMAYSEIKGKIHFGDLLEIHLQGRYDLVLGLDIFEHLNPNKLQDYIARCFNLLIEGGLLFTNIPAFCNDEVFGEVFPIYLEAWMNGSDSGGLFSNIHVDDHGWPLNGHLIWGTSRWWQTEFEKAGFQRQTQTERELHVLFDPFYTASAPARRSFYVFSKPRSGLQLSRDQ